MKRSTCYALIGVGILVIVWSYLNYFLRMYFALIGLILIIIGIVKWNSEKEFKSLKQRANVKVNVKGKMKDLK